MNCIILQLSISCPEEREIKTVSAFFGEEGEGGSCKKRAIEGASMRKRAFKCLSSYTNRPNGKPNLNP